MGRGRQRAKQQKIARKLKYLTTDTDYDELAKELNAQEPGTGSVDPFADVEEHETAAGAMAGADAGAADSAPAIDDDLDEYAKWAAEAAAKATSGEMPAVQAKPAAPRKPIPMPKPHPMPHPHAA